MSRRWAFVGLPVTLLGAASAALVGCSRTPPEPAPASTTNTSSAITADKAAPRAAATDAPAPSTPVTTGAAAAAPSAMAATTVATGSCITAMASAAPALPPPASAAACPSDPDGVPKLKIAQVAFPEAPQNPKVEVELVATEDQIQRGLMYRRTMPEDHGMLFRLGERRDHTFWMHNTCMALDMLFVDDDGMVVCIVEGATPLTDSTRSVGCPSTWVLEVNAGWCRRHGVRPGQKMGIPPAAR